MRSFLIAAMLVGVVHTAQAADMPDLPFLRGSFQDGPVAPRPTWDGLYVGGQASYGSTVSNIAPNFNSSIQPTSGNNWPTLASPQANNSGYGGFAGYNSQWDDVIIGVEANYIHGNYNTFTRSDGVSSIANGSLPTTSTASFKIADFGSMRLRAGYVAGNFLPYAFIGGGVGNMVMDRSAAVSPGTPQELRVSTNKSNLVYGYSAGLGVDIMLVAGLFVRAEYEYQRITSKDVDGNVNSARVGVGYKF